MDVEKITAYLRCGAEQALVVLRGCTCQIVISLNYGGWIMIYVICQIRRLWIFCDMWTSGTGCLDLYFIVSSLQRGSENIHPVPFHGMDCGNIQASQERKEGVYCQIVLYYVSIPVNFTCVMSIFT